MKASELVQPLSLDEMQKLRRLARHPDFRGKAATIVSLIRANRDQVQEFASQRRTELVDAEKALDIANRCLQEAESVLAELQA